MTAALLLLAVPGIGFDGGYWQPGGYEARIGSPYYYSVPATGGWHGYGRRRHHGRCGCAGRYGDSSYGNAWHGGNGAYYGGWGTDPYSYHFGPGYYRRAEHGHFRFPYYNYRAPWYYPGQPVFNRDTNFAW